MSDLFTITFALLIAFIFAEIFSHLGFSRVIGKLLAGLFLAIPFLQDSIFAENSIAIIEVLASLGVIFLLLLTGLEIDTKKMRKNSKDALFIAFFAALIPFLSGLFLARFLDYSWTTAFVLGAALSLTAEGTKATILIELKKIKTKIGSIMLEAGIIDDIIGILFLSIIIVLSKGENLLANLTYFPAKIIFFFFVSFLSFKYFPKVFSSFEKKHSEIVIFNLTIILGLIFALFSEVIGLGTVLGAFIAGVILQKSFALKSDELKEEKDLKLLTFGFIIPFFFIYISINFDYHSILHNPGLTFLILFIAIIGKIIGTLIAKPFTSLSWQQLHLIGWGMNSRGVMELIIAEIARSNGLISNELFSAIVFMAITTTLIFPIILKQIIKINPKIMQ